jgi:hypothetical protein
LRLFACNAVKGEVAKLTKKAIKAIFLCQEIADFYLVRSIDFGKQLLLLPLFYDYPNLQKHFIFLNCTLFILTPLIFW